MLDEKIKWLFERCKASVSISLNNHRDYYQSIPEYLEDQLENGEVDKEVLDKMVNQDTLICVQAYPDTPVGFYSEYHYDLETALDLVTGYIKNQNQC
jgi:hypothetical protein